MSPHRTNGIRHAGATALLAAVFLGVSPPPASGRNLLCTTFPLHLFVRNIAQGREGVRIERLLPASLGCPHHYALTPHDMRRLAAADVLVVNGLGLEEFLGAPLHRANPDLRVIDSSRGAAATLPAQDLPHGGRSAANPHLFASPRRAAQLVRYIAAEMGRADPDGAGLYLANGRAYAERMDRLADEMAAAVAMLANRRIVQPHGVFDYLAQDLGLEIVGVTRPHGIEPSAAELIALVETVRARHAGVVLWEPQYPANAARNLAREVGIAAAPLDPVASGPEDAPLDHYEQIMRRNLVTLRQTLGRRAE